jgi:lysyl-tRNA synthetase class 2
MSDKNTPAAPAADENQKNGGPVAFPNDFKPRDHAQPLHALHGEKAAEQLASEGTMAKVAGRMMLQRVMGKASFAMLQDQSGRIQVYVTRDDVGEEVYAAFKRWDLGDIVAAEGKVFKTRTGELSIHASSVRLLTKSLRPMPDKFHGIADQEVKYRQRYVDLMTDEAARNRFIARSKAISGIRDFMVRHDFLEVETPMLPARLSRTTTRWTRKCSCGSRRSCTSSGCWWAASSGCSRSTAAFATKASRCGITPNSR